MSEGEVVAQLVDYTNVLLTGVSVLFTVVSAYIAALNYFIGQANFVARTFAFLFVSLVLATLAAVMIGAQLNHAGLIARLIELDAEGQLTAAGRALLANASPERLLGRIASVDDVVRGSAWGAAGAIYLSLFYLTFLHRWRREPSLVD